MTGGQAEVVCVQNDAVSRDSSTFDHVSNTKENA